MENFKDEILRIMNERVISHKGFDGLSCTLAKLVKCDESLAKSILGDLISSGDVFEYGRGRFAGSRLLGLIKGKYSYTNERFGFVLNADGDIFVSKKNSMNAFDGDIVLCKVTGRAYNGKKREGKIEKIISRDNDGLVGTFYTQNGLNFVNLDRKNMDVRIAPKDTMGARPQDKVVIDILSYKSGRPVGRVIEVIGNLNDKGADIKWLLRSYKVRDIFPKEVIEYAKSVPQEVVFNKESGRRDLRDQMIVTIDGVDAKDLDDAVTVTKNADGTYKLGVHIADVGEYVKLNNLLDQEAYKRATSIYFLDQVIPMLPKELSNGICSLNPHVDRLALSVEMIIDKDGNVTKSEIFESVINSKHRLNYDQVLRLLDGDEKEAENLKDIKQMMFDMLELSQILENRRKKCGMLNFEIPEGEVIVDEMGKPVKIEKRLPTKSTKIIETFMVVANETVAKTFENLKIPFVYRVHEKPDSEKIATFFNFIDTLGLKLPSGKKDIEPIDLQKVLVQVEGKNLEGVVNMMMLRSLKKAKYLDKCLGHFGMALDFYCHFTSPIRRYPDLTIHRIIKEWLHGNSVFVKSGEMADFVQKASEQSSTQEKLSEDVERAITDYKKCEYMENYIGETFEGIISGVREKGFYVELDNTCEGLVSVSSLTDDFYTYDEQSLSLVSHNNFYKIGEKVEVKLVNVNKKERKIDFEVIRKIR